MTLRYDSIDEYIAAMLPYPFEWGAHDCWQLIGGASEILTGRNPAAKHKGRYKTALGAARILKKDYGGAKVDFELAAEYSE